MKYLAFILITALVFVGCAPKFAWHSADKTIEETGRDYKECSRYANERDRLPYSRYSDGVRRSVSRDYINSCMLSKGYQLMDVETLESEGSEYYKAP